jgi:hypothetical protein
MTPDVREFVRNQQIDGLRHDTDFSDWLKAPPHRVSVDLDREEIYELGRKGPYHRLVTFPIKAVHNEQAKEK